MGGPNKYFSFFVYLLLGRYICLNFLQVTTRETIIKLGDQLIRDKGFNAFSFYDISKKLKIKNASVHYHFHTKTDLGVCVLEHHTELLNDLKRSVKGKSPVIQLKAFLAIYSNIRSEDRVCLVGSLSTDLKTVDNKIARNLKAFAGEIVLWVTHILQEGREQGVFVFSEPPRTKALLVITNMLAALQISRLTGEKDFYIIQEAVIKGLKA